MNRDSTNRNDKRFWVSIVVTIIIVMLIIWGMNDHGGRRMPSEVQTGIVSTSTQTAAEISENLATSSPAYTYSCDGGKKIAATFHLPKDNFINIHLSDGRGMVLAHVISADGARYANADESFVFWTRGDTAFVIENGTSTYSGCVATELQ